MKTRTSVRSASSQHRHAGFTLIEMLVVIAIIALLASLVMPAVTKTLASAKRTACMSNMRQLGQAIYMYQLENKGYLPPVRDGNWSSGKHWMELISPYLGEEVEDVKQDEIAAFSHACPVWQGRKDLDELAQETKQGIGMNVYPARTEYGSGPALFSERAIALEEVEPTAILLGDSVDWHLALSSGDWWSGNNDYGYTSGHPDRHGRNANYLLADGSVTTLRPDDALEQLKNP